MKLLTGLAFIASAVYAAADVQYSVVAFPAGGQSVSVSVGGQQYPLANSAQYPNIFSGSAPSGNTYQYVLTGTNGAPESTTRNLASGTTKTGNEFFNRTQTVYSVPGLPQAFNPIYNRLETNFNQSTEISTIIMWANQSSLDAMLAAPTTTTIKDVETYNMTYISSTETHFFEGLGFQVSGKSTKDFAKQSYKFSFNQYQNKTTDSLWGRKDFKLRADETDPTLMREKLMLDSLLASGAASLSGQWARLYINNVPFGLYLMMDDGSSHFFEAELFNGDNDDKTPLGNAIGETVQGNLVYLGNDSTKYSADAYTVADYGNVKAASKAAPLAPLMDFCQKLNAFDPSTATDAQHPGNITDLINPQHTLIHLAMNFLGGSWDGLWYAASNYYLTQNSDAQNWTIITYDFDETFGNGAAANLVNVSYENYVPTNEVRPIATQFLTSPYYKTMFESTLKTILKRFFKPSILNPRLEAQMNMLKEDIAWDRSLTKKSPGTDNHFTLDQFLTNVKSTSGGMLGLEEWVTQRSAATCQQLNITDTDDLPPLPPPTWSNTNIAVNNATSNATGTATGASSGKASGAQTTSVSALMTIVAAVTAYALL
ncbi:coth protein-domain-containing protein [Umbelopsis sp. AD052]|nr:coth protein-domain-containing protein [Umbelopsis sp. AD052]